MVGGILAAHGYEVIVFSSFDTARAEAAMAGADAVVDKADALELDATLARIAAV